MRERGDRDGQLLWLRIRRAIAELQAAHAVPIRFDKRIPGRMHQCRAKNHEEKADRFRATALRAAKLGQHASALGAAGGDAQSRTSPCRFPG
jgi:hypothetical protein